MALLLQHKQEAFRTARREEIPQSSIYSPSEWYRQLRQKLVLTIYNKLGGMYDIEMMNAAVTCVFDKLSPYELQHGVFGKLSPCKLHDEQTELFIAQCAIVGSYIMKRNCDELKSRYPQHVSGVVRIMQEQTFDAPELLVHIFAEYIEDKGTCCMCFRIIIHTLLNRDISQCFSPMTIFRSTVYGIEIALGTKLVWKKEKPQPSGTEKKQREEEACQKFVYQMIQRKKFYANAV
jgi:hypothetical protein